ncbi:MAG: lipoprotein [Alphaproteobacteria bacterium]|nr:lipoprotein [Alphaproteobacteria bacterium]
MKKIILFMMLAIMLGACGVKSDLQHPSGKDFPRNYPTR